MAPQDSFIDDEEECCPLCIEPFDLYDKNFHPCPCGYQICQFCFNNLKNNLNGLCPACRRPYSEETISFKTVTPEEIAEFRANIQKNAKRRAAEQRQREQQKHEADKGQSRKNLVGVRVVQKNLVYVTGLQPTVPEDELLKTLRKPEFFGQYGNIQKISISNRKAPDGQAQSLGIYVTFEKREDAAKCIQAVNGSQNGDRVLKAQLGTTKYCSSWLRGEQCTNRQCMFLHEQGDEEDSYTRQDLSSLNSMYTQFHRPSSNAASSSRSASRQQVLAPQPQLTSQAMARTSSKEGSDIGDGPALPASANWARTTQQRSRRGSHATSGAASSPAVSAALPVTTESTQEAIEEPATSEEPAPPVTSRKAEKQPATESRAKTAVPSTTKRAVAKDPFGLPSLMEVIKKIATCPEFNPPKEGETSFLPLFDTFGGLRRRALREEEDAHSGEPDDQNNTQEASEGEPESGSLALGGEPEDRVQSRDSSGFDQRRNPTQPPIQRSGTDPFGLGSNFSQGSSNIGSIGSRTMTPQQQLFLRTPSSFADQMPPGIPNPQSSLFQGQGHARQQSRFSFANENASPSTNVKLAADRRIMAQQSSMMPSSFHSQPGSQYYTSSMPGPPPGLPKSTGTPPVSGSMFGQGHGFGGSGFGVASKDTTSDLLQSFMRGRGAGSSSAHDAGKHDELLPLDEESVDALVSDPYPLDLESLGSFGPNDFPTLALPPGFDFIHSHPPVQPGETDTPIPPPQVTQSSSTVAARPPPPAVPRPVTPLIPKAALKKTAKEAVAGGGSSDAKKNIKELAVESGLAKDIAAQASSASKGKGILQEEDFPALDSVKHTSPQKVTPALPSKLVGKAKKGTDASTKSSAQKASASAEKRPVPVTLDIAAATKTVAQTKDAETSSDAKKAAAATNTAPSSSTQASKSVVSSALPTPTLSSANLSSPVTRVGPKTLRLVQTPKAELPPNIPPSAVSSIRAAAVSAAGRPGTPASEPISDSASVISASVSASRTSSPPPSRVGTAALRTTTKSQQRKQRTKASKEATAAILAEPKPAEQEVEVAPILGRKKKQKKEKKEKAPAAVSGSPAASRPETPAESTPKPDTSSPQKTKAGKTDNGDEKGIQKGKGAKSQTAPESPVKAKDQKGKDVKSPLKSPPVMNTSTSIRLNESTKTTVLTPSYVNPTAEVRPEPVYDENAVGEIPSLSEILQSLIEEGELPDPDDINLFKPLQNYRIDWDRSVPASLPPTVKSVVTKDDEAELNAFRPVRKEVHGHRVLLTPNGDFVLNLTEEEENRFLELQASVAKTNGLPTAFTAPKYAPGTGFSLIKGRAVPNGMPSFFPAGPGSYPSNPVEKMHREEAIGCINQHVLPTLNLGSYKPNSTLPNTNGVNLQTLAPWFTSSESTKDGRRIKLPRAREPDSLLGRMQNTDENWDDEHADDDEATSSTIGGAPLMSIEEAETILAASKKQHDATDKKFKQAMARIRRQMGLH